MVAMTDPSGSLRRWPSGRAAALGAAGALAAAALAAGCSTPASSGTGGAGGAESTTSHATTTHATTTTATTSTGSAAGTGGDGTGGAAGTGGSTTTSSSAGTGGAGTGGADTGGAGGSFTRPAGTIDYPAETEPNDLVSDANPLQPGTDGFTASIWPLGDIDVFEVDVTVAGSSLAVSTSNGAGGCPAGAHTYVRVFDSAGTVLAFDPGTNGCASFTPANSEGLIDLPVGKYYVHVESALLEIIPVYVVAIHVSPPVCGDGIVEVLTGEQCDHGSTNGATGDGCSATCQIESGKYLDEIEPNDTQATANSLVGYAGAVGSLNPAGDVDWYTVDVTVPNSSITATIDDGFGNCPLAFDSQLQLFGSSTTPLVTVAATGVAPCSRIAPQVYPAAANLPVGTYALEVSRITSALQPSYVLTVNVAPPTCGDGIVEPGEQCDPGAASVPECSATCQLTGDLIPETEPNNTQTTANPLGTHAGFIGAIEPAGDLDYFSFQVPGPQSLVSLQISDGIGGCPTGLDSALSFYGPGGSLLLEVGATGVAGCSLISPAQDPQIASSLAAGTYYARVGTTTNTATCPLYVLGIAVWQPACGDGFVEAGEQCDDGAANGSAGDGCSATCTSLSPWEIEPNNTLTTATPLWSGTSTWKAAITPVGDHDYFRFVLSTAGTVTLVTHDLGTPAVCSSDTVLYLDNSLGTQITMDDDSGPGPGDPSDGGKCSLITKALPAATYYAWVQRSGDSKIIPGYQLDLTIQ